MSKAVSDSDETLDPEVARLAARIRRLMFVSGATTLIAIGAVFAVIGYRVFKAEGSATVTDVTVVLPKDARVIGTGFADGRIAVTLETSGVTEVRTFDAKTLQPTGRLRLSTEP